MLDIETAHLIQRALGPECVVRHPLALTDDTLRGMLAASGLEWTGVRPRFSTDAAPFWGEWRLVDRERALAAIAPFLAVHDPLEFSLTPVADVGPYLQPRCPACGAAHVSLEDRDCIAVPVLPEGVDDYGYIDPSMSVGHCTSCGQGLYTLALGFSSVANPDGAEFCVLNLTQIPDGYERFRAEAPGCAPWAVTRLHFKSGRLPEDFSSSFSLPKGPFIVDYHQLGPFPIALRQPLKAGYLPPGKVSHGCECATASRLFHRLAGVALAAVRRAAGVSSVPI